MPCSINNKVIVLILNIHIKCVNTLLTAAFFNMFVGNSAMKIRMPLRGSDYMYLIASSRLVTRMSNKDERYYKIPFQQKTE